MKNQHNIKHLAIIMDGNGRWAVKKKLPVVAGHKQGAESAKEITKACIELGIGYLTLYTFSAENWNRPEDEVKNILKLLEYYLGDEAEKLAEKGVRLKFIGDISAFSEDIQNRCEQLEVKTTENDRLTVSIALNYGGRQEIINAVNQAVRAKKEVSVDEFTNLLYTNKTPDPDLLIRTGGDLRISNFLLWQCAYTEFYFTETLWPDFNKNELMTAVDDYNNRERRFGGRTKIKSMS
jgi:undecaprenyl diphosphate synthase